jgi:hypothetical protein
VKIVDEGGSAFPFEQTDFLGLTKRDYFAAAALSLIGGRRWDDIGSDMRLIQTWAVSAYAIADALIAASKTGGPEHG